MKDGALKILGVSLIFLGILGFLFFGVNILGNVINESIEENLVVKDFLDIVIKENEEKEFNLVVSNVGEEPLTGCSLEFSGEASDWISDDENIEILGGESIEFKINVRTPEKIQVGEYPFDLNVSCNEATLSKIYSVSVIKGINAVKIREMKLKGGDLNIIYTFNKEGFIGDETYVEIWVHNPDGFEVNRLQDSFSLKGDSLVVRDIVIDLNERPNGVYSVYFAHPSDQDDYLKKSVILGKSKSTGNAVFEIAEGKGLPYLAFLIFIGIGTFFIFMSHRRHVRRQNEKIANSLKQ